MSDLSLFWFTEREMSVRFSSFKGMQVRNIIDLFILRAFRSSEGPPGCTRVGSNHAMLPFGSTTRSPTVDHRGLLCFTLPSFYSFLSSPPFSPSPELTNPHLAKKKKIGAVIFFRFRWSLRATQSGQGVSKDKKAKNVKKRWVHNYSHGSVVIGASMCEYTS